MTQSQHTPGPWALGTYSDENVRDAVGVFAPNANNLRIVADVWGRTLDQCDANARLIASAPALLAEAMELIRNVVDYRDGYATVLTQDVEALELAVRAALGHDV